MHCRDVRIQPVSSSNVMVLLLEHNLNPAMYKLSQLIKGFVLDHRKYSQNEVTYPNVSVWVWKLTRWDAVPFLFISADASNAPLKGCCKNKLQLHTCEKGNMSQSRKQVSVANGTWLYIFVENVTPII